MDKVTKINPNIFLKMNSPNISKTDVLKKIHEAIDAVIDLESMDIEYTQYLIRQTMNSLRSLESTINNA